jgi:hypothetical protein
MLKQNKRVLLFLFHGHIRFLNHLLMKKLLLVTAVIVFISFNGKAQVNKGAILLGGNVNFSASSSKTENPDNKNSNTGFSIQPSIGIAIRTNLVAGLEVGYGQDKSSNSNSHESRNNYKAGIFIRKYLPVANRISLFGQSSLFYTKQMETENFPLSNYITRYKITTGGLSFTPGLAVAATKKLQLEISLGQLFALSYNHQENENSGNNSSSSNRFYFTTAASSSIPLNVGFRFLFGNK